MLGKGWAAGVDTACIVSDDFARRLAWPLYFKLFDCKKLQAAISFFTIGL
jgi:hypothetical protein